MSIEYRASRRGKLLSAMDGWNGRGCGDPALSEYVVRVRWLRAVPREEAFWIPGLFANQNSVARLRHGWTLERLCEAFEVSPEG
jgi:hypothetical protein